MPRFLDTYTGKFEWHEDPTRVRYAILSHTWGKDEQSFVDVRAIGERCRANGKNPRDDPELSTKIRKFFGLSKEDDVSTSREALFLFASPSPCLMAAAG